MRLGVDPRKADQMVRGTVNLPHGTGKTARVIVFAAGARPPRPRPPARTWSARRPDRPDPGRLPGLRRRRSRPRTRWRKVGRIAPHPRPARPDAEPEDRHRDHGRGQGRHRHQGRQDHFRVDKQSNLHLVIGKASFPVEQLVENYAAALDEVLRAKPSAAKGQYLKKVTFTHHDGPGHPGRPERARATCSSRSRPASLSSPQPPPEPPRGLGGAAVPPRTRV